jgi:hypothetical protein
MLLLLLFIGALQCAQLLRSTPLATVAFISTSYASTCLHLTMLLCPAVLVCHLQAGNVAVAEEASQSAAAGPGAVLPTLSLLRVVDLVDALWEHMPQVGVHCCFTHSLACF